MRGLGERGALDILSSEVLSVLQLCAINEPLLPNLKSLHLWTVTGEFFPIIPLFLSPRITTINISSIESDLPKVVITYVVNILPTLCPNLQDICIRFDRLPKDPTITAALSGMVLATNRNTLQHFNVDSPLTEEAREVICKLPYLRRLSVIIERDTSLPTVVLPNLAELVIEYDHDHVWLQGFRGATLGKLASVALHSEAKPFGDFLEAFESVALTTSIPATLSTFSFYTPCPWRPNYRSLLPFTQLKELDIDFSCEFGCSSTVDDDIITDIARAMPRITALRLGGDPCQTPTGVTTKGLATLAHYCLHLSTLRIHFQVASLDPPTIPWVISGGEPTIPREGCALRCLEVGEIPVPEESTLMVALTLLRIFPRIDHIQYSDEGWGKVGDAFYHSKQLVRCSSKELSPPRSIVDDTSPRSHTRERSLIKKYSQVPSALTSH
jgi:hypothetical protein